MHSNISKRHLHNQDWIDTVFSSLFYRISLSICWDINFQREVRLFFLVGESIEIFNSLHLSLSLHLPHNSSKHILPSFPLPNDENTRVSSQTDFKGHDDNNVSGLIERVRLQRRRACFVYLVLTDDRLDQWFPTRGPWKISWGVIK
jgi:hypothetical protein